ncbi:proteasome accessory factor A [Austwickia chelonae]|uniref:Pup--protein ligase n=1 Tax=Austwickia chelonae NBRC 105200 TaxID=1184607 RepID=K6V4S3_9MICO|nr:Pup--protein ligase [Austwickia chelonae]GAB77158.1 Pup--protein ligase [Austwickia chelonae NBRC 105200]SEW04100.1 proteasome accessory factor A [Austwickia chelonae]
MDRRILGLETEYGVTCHTEKDHRPGTDDIVRHLFRDIVRRHRSSNVFLRNGGRLYLDVGNHPEYATAECDTLPDLLAHDRAGILILHDMVARAEELMAEESPDVTVFLLRNNVDSVGNSYGCHENYLIDRSTDLTVLSTALTPFLVTRQLVCGAGRLVVAPDGRARYCLSQRAEVIWEGASSATTRARPMINTRDEPHADASRHRRLHVIVGDSNMAESSTLLKVATLDLVLRALEAGRLPPDLTPVDTASAIRTVGHDLTGRAVFRTASGTVGAVDVQRAYHVLAAEHLAEHGPSRPWDEAALSLWDEVLGAVEAGEAHRVARHVDWAAKHMLLTRQVARHGLDWSDPRLAQLDLLYHDIDPRRGVAARLEKAGHLHRWTTEEDAREAMTGPPSTTRARLRGAVVAAAEESGRPCRVDWTHLRIDGDEGRTVICKDPFAHVDERVDRLISSMRG